MGQTFRPQFGSTAALRRIAAELAPRLEKADSLFRTHLKASFDGRQIKALCEITAGAAACLLAAGKPVRTFLEQVEYNGRRLAKLNVPPAAALRALAAYDRMAPAHGLAALHTAVVLAIHNAYYRVRQEEAQAFFDLFRAELKAADLDDMLARFATILSRTFRARAARLFLGRHDSRRRFIETGDPAETFILDASWHGRYRSYWSIPFFMPGGPTGLIQLAFATRYEWLPRELELLDAVAERCLAAAEKARLTEEVRDLAAHMFQVEEEERRRISRELHDEAGQSLLLARLQLEMLEKQTPPGWDGREKLANTREVVERTIVEIRRILAALSPAVLEQLGLAAAIRQLTTRFRASCPARVTLRIALRRLDRNIETVAYRLVQECYHNISRHSAASHVKVSVRSTDGFLGLRIEDDGVGFDPDAAMAQVNSFGLAGMRERVTLMGGSFEIRSGPSLGTAVAIRLPLQRKGARQQSAAQRASVQRS